MDMNTLLAQAKSAVLPDQTKAPAGFERIVPPAGLTTARLVGYIEMGKVPNVYDGKEKGTQLAAKLVFELNGPKHIREHEGEKSTSLYYENVSIKTGEKATFRKLFMKMRAGRDDITHMAQMLGDPFLVRVSHAKGKGDKSDVVYANIRDENGEWGVQMPFIEDPVSGEVRAIPVPAVTQPYRLLLWGAPTKEQWDSLFIDGTYTKTVGEVEKEISKNWLQNAIMRDALDFATSPLHDILDGLGELTLDPDSTDPDADMKDDADFLNAPQTPEKSPPVPVEAKAVEPEPKTVEAPKIEEKAAEKPAGKPAVSAQSVDDIFAELGLNT